MGNELPHLKPASASREVAAPEEPFGSNEFRLDLRHWLIALALTVFAALLTPQLWQRIEAFDTGPDYRIPYALSEDYWLYGRRLRQVAEPNRVIVLGDSVVWGEYVLPDGTLSHFLNREAGANDRFVNGGVNGFFPLAMEGLIECYGGSLRHQKLIVHCNVLWMTSPKADLSLAKEESFNHSRLVPQFFPRISCYRADANERLAAIVERNVSFIAWVGHLQSAYFGQKSIPRWTLEDDGRNPPRCPNVYRNPLSAISLHVPAARANDPQRGPKSQRHKPWSQDVQPKTSFEWVDLDASLQWGAFRRLIGALKRRGNDVFVILGPFNEHLMADESRPAYSGIRDGIVAWLSHNHVPHLVPDLLPSALYADASHPLTEGYELLAQRTSANEGFRKWTEKE